MLRIEQIRQDQGMDGHEENVQTMYDECYFTLITYGKCVYWVNRHKILLEKGDMLLVPAKTNFYWKRIPTVFHAKYVLRFKFAENSPVPSLFPVNTYHVQKLGRYEVIHERMKRLVQEWTEGMLYGEEYAAALFTEIWIDIQRENAEERISPHKHRMAETMKSYIQERYRKKITKHDLAVVIQKSPNYAATLFRSVTGQTISEYVHVQRTKAAVYMLSNSQLTVSETAEVLGYNDVSYFHKIFKRHTGKSPSVFVSERPTRRI